MGNDFTHCFFTTAPEKNHRDARAHIHLAVAYYKSGQEQKTYEQEQIVGKLLRGRPALKRNLQKKPRVFLDLKEHNYPNHARIEKILDEKMICSFIVSLFEVAVLFSLHKPR